MKEMLAKIKSMIVHGGKSHIDEAMALSIVIARKAIEMGVGALNAVYPLHGNVFRRDPTQEEIEDPTVFVADVGKVYDPYKLCFDHHQFPRGDERSAMGLVADWCGLREFLDKVYPWFSTRVRLDAIGPFATAKAAGTSWAVIQAFMGPGEQNMLKRFEDNPLEVATELAEDIINKYYAYKDVENRVYDYKDLTVPVRSFEFCADSAEVVGSAFYLDEGISIFKDKRGDGLAFLRMGDDPRVDFRLVAERTDLKQFTGFIHPNGFYMTITSGGDVTAFVKAAMTGKEKE